MSDQPEKKSKDDPLLSVENQDVIDFIDRTSQSPGCMKGLLIGLAMIIAAFFLGVFLIHGTVTGAVNAFVGLFDRSPQSAVTQSSQTIVNSVRPLGQLVSMSAQLAKADINVRIREGFPNLCGFSASHVAVGTIEAGVDLSRITEDDISLNDDILTITLPPAQITSCRIEDIRQYERSATACRVDWDGARRLAQHITINEFYEDAIEGGLLDRASLEATVVLSNFLNLSTGHMVEIQFRDEAPATPASCRPQAPDGWSFDEENNAWSQSD